MQVSSRLASHHGSGDESAATEHRGYGSRVLSQYQSRVRIYAAKLGSTSRAFQIAVDETAGSLARRFTFSA